MLRVQGCRGVLRHGWVRGGWASGGFWVLNAIRWNMQAKALTAEQRSVIDVLEIPLPYHIHPSPASAVTGLGAKTHGNYGVSNSC